MADECCQNEINEESTGESDECCQNEINEESTGESDGRKYPFRE